MIERQRVPEHPGKHAVPIATERTVAQLRLGHVPTSPNECVPHLHHHCCVFTRILRAWELHGWCHQKKDLWNMWRRKTRTGLAPGARAPRSSEFGHPTVKTLAYHLLQTPASVIYSASQETPKTLPSTTSLAA